MNILKRLRHALAEIARDLFMTTYGRIALAVGCLVQVVAWWISDSDPWWHGALGVALTPVTIVLWVAIFQFGGGFVFALVHARRPTHSWLLLELKDGRQRRGLVCMAPCCLRRKVTRVFKTGGGKVQLSLDDGSDDEVFRRDEVEEWRVIPVDNPQPHEHGGRA